MLELSLLVVHAASGAWSALRKSFWNEIWETHASRTVGLGLTPSFSRPLSMGSGGLSGALRCGKRMSLYGMLEKGAADFTLQGECHPSS